MLSEIVYKNTIDAIHKIQLENKKKLKIAISGSGSSKKNYTIS